MTRAPYARGMHSNIETFVRHRASKLGLSLAEVCRRTGISRQTLYDLGQVPNRLPALTTVVALAGVLEVHPMRLLQLMFDEVPMKRQVREGDAADRSAFVGDVTLPDGAPVLAGSRFLKTWELQNVGTVPWRDRFLVCLDEEVVVYTRDGESLRVASGLAPDCARVPVPETPPGEKTCLDVWFTAPDTPGTVLSYWKMAYADGSLCFPDSRGLWAKLRVITPAKAAQNARAIQSS